MSKSLLAFVWIAGPLTGGLVQPYVGIKSDNCRMEWGKRKPFMAIGSVATVIALLALAWVKELVGGFLSVFGADPASTGVHVCINIVATILMYCLDIAINTGMALSSFPVFPRLLTLPQCKLLSEHSLLTTVLLINKN